MPSVHAAGVLSGGSGLDTAAADRDPTPDLVAAQSLLPDLAVVWSLTAIGCSDRVGPAADSEQRGDVMRGVGVAQGVLRTVVGGTMLAHGVKHARSLEGTAGWFGSIGFREPALQARASAAVEIGAGSALLAGAATPAAASAVIGTMTVAARSVHQPNGFFITAEGYEYTLVLAAAAAALAALGGGRISVDRLLGLDHRLSGTGMGLAAAGLGVAAAAGQLALYWTKPVAG